jgi:two-component system, chemotaxis family, chemotaxis protein CheY
MRAVVEHWLGQFGFRQIYAAADPEKALPIARAQRVDLIISDREMPGMSGLDFVQAVRRDPLIAKCGFVMISASKDMEVARHADELGVNSYIAKPFSSDVLREHLEKVLREVTGSEITFS